MQKENDFDSNLISCLGNRDDILNLGSHQSKPAHAL